MPTLKGNPPLLLNPATKRYLLRLAFWRTKCFFNFALSASVSTVSCVWGIHVTAVGSPAFSLGLFGHRNNPSLESFEKASELCRLINCKSWPSRKCCMKSHRKVSRSPGNLVLVSVKADSSLKTQRKFTANTFMCCILKLWNAAPFPTQLFSPLPCTPWISVSLFRLFCFVFVRLRQKDDETP